MNAPPPPRLARRVLQLALGRGERAPVITADLDEEFEYRVRAGGYTAARRWYWRAALGVSLSYIRRSPQRVSEPSHGASLMDSIFQDVRFAARTLRKSPGFTAAALVTLAVGIGSSTAIFSLLNSVVLRPLPFDRPGRLMFLAEADPAGDVFTIAWPNFQDWQRELQSFEAIAGQGAATFNLTGNGAAERLQGRAVSWNFLRLLGAQPVIGRDFEPADDQLGVDHRVLISHELWTRRYARAPDILGRQLMMDGHAHTVIGVLPDGFQVFRDDDIYEPFTVRTTPNSGYQDRGNHMALFAVGRLRDGVSEEAARQELAAVAAALEKAYPVTNAGITGFVQPLAHRITGDLRPTLLAMFAAVGFLLLIACVNVTNLQVARGAARQHELAVRVALGSGRLRLVRQLMAESLLLSAAGGLLGLAFGAGMLRVLLALAPAGLPRLDEVSLDGAALAFACGAVLLSGMMFGVIPAVHASRRSGQQALVRASRNAGGAASMRLRRTLIVAETALALILLTGAGLMLRTMQQLSSVDTGVDIENVATLRFTISNAEWDAARRRVFFDEVEQQARALPGVTDVALSMSLPIEGTNGWGSVFILGDRAPTATDLPSAEFSPVTPGFFSTMKMRIIEGRALEARDRGDAAHAIVVNETFAKRFWPGGGAVGQRLKQGWADSPTPWREIVGVVNDVKVHGVAEETPLQVYTPLAQDTMRSVALIARTSIAPESVLLSLSDLVKRLNGDLPVYNVATLSAMLAESTARERVTATVLGAFAAIALLLAAVGLFGVVSQGVTERTPEIGVRLALGAAPGAIVRLFLRGGVATAGTGIVLGAAGAFWLTRF
ncbi:MAG TPA: ADOP family duplicated permease, partial [Vicinamibacterales bacterium]